VLPLSAVRRLADFGGDFVLSVQCMACRHERPLPARELAKRWGREMPIGEIVPRLRCSRCGARRVDVQIAGVPR
jgi:hypothetical protein